MNIVNTIAPISIEDLKQYFKDKSTYYVIDYSNSKLTGTKLLTYLSNLDIPCDIDFNQTSSEDCYSMIKDYLNASVLVNIPSLEKTVIYLLNQMKGIIPMEDEQFIKDNSDILNQWMMKVDSLTVYNMSIIESPTFKQFIDQIPVDETKDLAGVNFISLIKNDEMYLLFSKVEAKNLRNYKHYFNDYMFKGKNLYSYWATDKNPLFLFTVGIATGALKQDEYNQQLKKEMSDVAPV